jgi:hypothetical protein
MTGEPRSAAGIESTRSGVRVGGQAVAPAYIWSDGRRFVEVFAVQTGWLVMWGSLNEGGDRFMLGNRVYLDLAGVRRRIAAAVFELTADRSAAVAAVVQFDRVRLPDQPLTERSLPR